MTVLDKIYMLKNLIKDICSNENLEDIAHLGKASQSSQSKWSKEDDAQRAVSGKEFKDFAFHTDMETNPWWQIDFPANIRPHYIIINNRKNEMYSHIASSIKVTVSNSNNDKVVLHQGLVFYGALPKSLPLILPLKAHVEIKSIKIELENNEPTYLHLGNINILTSKLIRSKTELPVFFANRVDGFGMRLSAVLSAMIYAKNYGSDFKFSWFNRDKDTYLNHHMSNKVEDVFDGEFINEHVIEKGYIDGLNLINASQYNEEINNELFEGYLCDYSNRNDFKNSDTSFREAFNSIGFSKSLLEAKRLAESIDLGEKTVAIHLRSGDIVYEGYRLFHSFHYKVTPAYIIPILIEKYKNDGYEVVLIGQEESFCQYLSKKYSVKYSGSIINKEFNTNQQGMFDIALLARMSLIISMGSAFTEVATLINNSKTKRYFNVLSFDEIRDGFQKFENGIGSLESSVITDLYKSFSYISFYRRYQNQISVEKKLEILDKCISLEPDSQLNKLLKEVARLYTKSSSDANSNILKFIESVEGKKYLDKFVKNKQSLPPVDYIFSEYIAEFKLLAERGFPSIAIILLMHEEKTGIPIKLSFYENILNEAKAKGYEGIDALYSKLSALREVVDANNL